MLINAVIDQDILNTVLGLNYLNVFFFMKKLMKLHVYQGDRLYVLKN